MNRVAFLIFSFALAGCTSSSPSTSSSSPDGGPLDGGALGEASASDGGSAQNDDGCDGETNGGILGSWSNEQAAGGDGPNGIVLVKVTYRFCGTPTSGSYRYEEDGMDTPYRGCRRIADLRGTFTLDGTKLLLTSKSGYQATEGCSDPTLNQRNDVTSDYTSEYQANVDGDTLTMISISAAGNSSPYEYTREP